MKLSLITEAECKAYARHNRIYLDIQKGMDGYDEFAAVLDNIDNDGCFSWFGDITTDDGDERSGLVITTKVL